MARYNEILVGSYNRFLQKHFGMKGSPPAPQLASEIIPIFGMFSGEENRVLAGWDLFSRSDPVGPNGLGINQACQLRNPAGSNVLAVITSIRVTAPVLDVFTISTAVGAADLANLLRGFRRDSRGKPNSACIVSNNTVLAAAALTEEIDRVRVIASTMTQLIDYEGQEIVLLPDSAVRIVGSSANTLQEFVFAWRERFLEESERT